MMAGLDVFESSIVSQPSKTAPFFCTRPFVFPNDLVIVYLSPYKVIGPYAKGAAAGCSPREPMAGVPDFQSGRSLPTGPISQDRLDLSGSPNLIVRLASWYNACPA